MRRRANISNLDAGLKREDVINLSHAEIVVELGKLGLDQHGRKLTHAKKAVLENQISLGGKIWASELSFTFFLLVSYFSDGVFILSLELI